MDKLIFLHIPKTAGQSVRRSLEQHFGKENCAPVLVDAQWEQHSLDDLDRYQIFSGHHDLHRFDQLTGKKCFFTLLRDPMERIASFYYFLRKEADRLGPEELAKPHRAGLRMAQNYSIDAYFADPDVEGRSFIDAHFDNLYSFYFAGGSYTARGPLLRQHGDSWSGRHHIVELAKDRLAQLDLVGTVEDMSGFSHRFERAFGASIDFAKTRLNVNETEVGASKAEQLLDELQTAQARARIKAFAAMDNWLIQAFEEI